MTNAVFDVTAPRGGSASSVPPTTALVRRYLWVRVGFGLLWGIDATFKWLPGFRHGYLSMIRSSAADQPGWLASWFHFWIRLTGTAPTAFAVSIALAETAICLSLVLGVAQRVGFVFGTAFAALIWGVGEGFGGPYGDGSTDVGCAILYSVVFLCLALTVPREVRAAAPSLDSRLVRSWPSLASLTFRRP
jgi:nitrite reductase (NO-forming)